MTHQRIDHLRIDSSLDKDHLGRPQIDVDLSYYGSLGWTLVTVQQFAGQHSGVHLFFSRPTHQV